MLQKFFFYFRYSVFHFFAIDVMFDFDLKPWLLEINDTPGLATKPKKVGKFIKNVLTEVLNIVNFNIPDNISEADKKLIQEELGQDCQIVYFQMIL